MRITSLKSRQLEVEFRFKTLPFDDTRITIYILNNNNILLFIQTSKPNSNETTRTRRNVVRVSLIEPVLPAQAQVQQLGDVDTWTAGAHRAFRPSRFRDFATHRPAVGFTPPQHGVRSESAERVLRGVQHTRATDLVLFRGAHVRRVQRAESYRVDDLVRVFPVRAEKRRGQSDPGTCCVINIIILCERGNASNGNTYIVFRARAI